MIEGWGNHIWQSTVFDLMIVASVFALRNAPARIRYRLWLVASLKFLVPCSLLVAVGYQLRPPNTISVVQYRVTAAMEEVGRPMLNAPLMLSTREAVGRRSNEESALFFVWLAGFLGTVAFWMTRVCRIQAVVRTSTPLLVPLQSGVRALSSPAIFEPGVFGFFRPVLLLPDGIKDRLTPAQLQTIVAHEVCHVRRRDNLAAAVHMIIQAIFWFHPLVWLIGAKLTEERERACDEEVLRLGSDPKVYAGAILEVCKHCVRWPLPCAAGVSGSRRLNLGKRLEDILSENLCYGRLTFVHKTTFVAVGGLIIFLPVLVGLAGAPIVHPQSFTQFDAISTASFEVAAIHPTAPSSVGGFIGSDPGGGLRAHGITVKLLIQNAYDLKSFQVLGAPSWAQSTRYDITAKADDPATIPAKQRKQLLEARLRSLLIKRFNLRTHESTRERPVYLLVVGKNGPKLETSIDGSDSSMRLRRGLLTAHSLTMALLAANLSNQLGRPVEDGTRLAGHYDFTLQWTPDRMLTPTEAIDAEATNDMHSEAPSLFTAVQEQLGLRLQSGKGLVAVLIVDHVDRPSAN